MEEGVNDSIFQVANVSTAAKAISIIFKGFEISWTLEMVIEDAIEELEGLFQILYHGIETR